MTDPRVVLTDPCIDVDIRTQTAGTCWFHAMTNPFILSQRLRPYLYKALAVYINAFRDKEHLKDWLKPQAPSCISPSKQYSRIFALKKLWGVLYHFPRPTYRTNRPPSTTSQNNIKNLLSGNFRSRAATANWGHLMTAQVDTFLKRVGYTNYALIGQNGNVITENGPPGKKDFVVFIIERNGIAAKQHTVHGQRYKLESGGIYLEGNDKFRGAGTEHARHGITGFKCKTDGEFMIYDSNMTKSYKCDWSNPANVLANRNYQSQTNTIYRGNNAVANNERAKWTMCALNFVVYVPDDANNRDPAYHAYIHDEYKISPEQIRRKAAANAPQPGAAANNAARRNINAAAANPNLNARITNLRAKLRNAGSEALKQRIRNHLQTALNAKAQRNAAARVRNEEEARHKAAANNEARRKAAANNEARRKAVANINAAAANPNLNARITNLRTKLRNTTNETLKMKIRNHLQAALNIKSQRTAAAGYKNNAYREALRKATTKQERNAAYRERFNVKSWTNAELKLATKAVSLGGGAGMNMVKNQRPIVRNAVKNAINRVVSRA